MKIGPNDAMLMAYNRMRMYDVSQLPVMDNGKIVGIIDESDILWAVQDQNDRFNSPVRDAMISDLELMPHDAPIADLLPVFKKDQVAIIMDGELFLGIITRMDLLNFLRRQPKHW